jgi:phosphoribosylamine--glycine ligase
MLTADGPRVLEFNTRFGDPETQAIVPRVAEDLLALLHAAATGTLEDRAVAVHPGGAVAVVLASRGYPSTSSAGDEIAGLDEAAETATIYHAGTARRGGHLVTAGGRVLAVSAVGASVAEAGAAAYEAVARIRFAGMQWRTDIAARAGTVPVP